MARFFFFDFALASLAHACTWSSLSFCPSFLARCQCSFFLPFKRAPGFAAGAMVCMVFAELIPEALEGISMVETSFFVSVVSLPLSYLTLM